ncbi:DUF4397 domain-containing protein [Deinococcus sp. SDU3-2]|uniref:DUF4397 domain-containing protein n=1 Tax=Deinococcus terrestris TaxID=2651870 RepID=A0A7X1NUZ9_9DEIO|nr:DUF4397 domain-containing protein [Deinococcus terrestris]MPY66215.1 DUF4397 domain-containing protein [Deinococcus terrestris]
MRTPLSKALLLAALLAPAVAPAQAARVYFLNDHAQSGLVDVYVNGRLLFDNMFPAFPTMFGHDLAPGKHTFVVTASNVPPGPANLLETELDIAQWGEYTLKLSGGTDLNFPALALALSRR